MNHADRARLCADEWLSYYRPALRNPEQAREQLIEKIRLAQEEAIEEERRREQP